MSNIVSATPDNLPPARGMRGKRIGRGRHRIIRPATYPSAAVAGSMRVVAGAMRGDDPLRFRRGPALPRPDFIQGNS